MPHAHPEPAPQSGTVEHAAFVRQALGAAMDEALDGFMLFESVRDANGRVVDFTWLYANPAAERVINRPAGWCSGRRMLEELPGNRASGLFDASARVVETGEVWSSEIIYQRDAVDLFARLAVVKVGDGVSVSITDLSEQRRAEEQVRASEERLRSVFESIDEGFCIVEVIFDAANRPIDYRFIQVNPLFEQLTGLVGAVGRTAHDLVPDQEGWWLDVCGRVALTGESVRFEHRSAPMGRSFDVYAARVGSAQSRQVALVFRNITAPKATEDQARAALAAEQAARQATERAFERTTRLQAFTAALAGALTRSAVIQVITDHGIAATEAAIVVVGLLDPVGERFEIVGWVGNHAELAAVQQSLPLDEMPPPATAVRTGEPIWLSSREAAEARFPGFGAVMERFGDHAHATLPLLVSGSPLGVLVFGYPQPRSFDPAEQAFLHILAQQCAQALERAQLYADLLVSQERLQQLSQRLIETQEQERRHLARELHDEIGQALTGLRLAIELAAKVPPDDRAAQLVEAHQVTQELIARIRALSLDLRPAMLDDMGLLPALIWQIKRYREQTGISVELRHWGLEQRLPLATETVVYRVIQEALTNIARHAGVTTANVRVLATGSQLLVQVRDAGRGFVLSEALAHAMSSGLAGMQERVALLGGTLSIETGPGKGTAITADLPLPEEPEP
jgi:signal transduction histidine kinase